MMEIWAPDEQLFGLYLIDTVNIVTDSVSTFIVLFSKFQVELSRTYVLNICSEPLGI